MSILLNWTLYNDTESVIKATDKDAQWDLLAILFSFNKKNSWATDRITKVFMQN